MKKLLKYFNGYKKECVLGPLFKLCEAALELIVPLIIALIIDTGLSMEDGGTRFIIVRCLWLLGLGAIGFIFSVTAQFFCARAAVGFATKLRSALFSHLQCLSHTDLDTLGTSTMITRMTADANQVQTGVNLTLRLFLRSPFVVFGAMIMAMTIDLKMTGIFGVTILILSVIVFGIMLISMPLYKKVQHGVDGVVSKTRENLSGARVIRAFCKEDSESDEFAKRNAALARMQKAVGRISALMNPLTFTVINIAIIVLIHTGAIQLSDGNLTSGEVVALYNYMSQILVELIKLANLIITITKSLACASRIGAVFEIEKENVGGEAEELGNGEYAVEFDNVSFTYSGGGAPALSNISFKIKRGQTLGIIGGTGSGKTSLVNLVPRFYDATDGKIKLFGTDIADYTRRTLTDAIATVPQKAVLFAGTVRENMLFGNENATDEQIMHALGVAQALDVVNDKGGLDARIEAGGKNLSGGQKQRLTIARALVKNPKILILDDSASALDFATDAALRKAIRNLEGDITVLIVSQRASSIMYADKIIVLDDGKSDGVGTHGELIEKSWVYREIYNSQFDTEGAR